MYPFAIPDLLCGCIVVRAAMQCVQPAQAYMRLDGGGLEQSSHYGPIKGQANEPTRALLGPLFGVLQNTYADA